ncbi:MAG: Bug family tripartite tricarboxylate transporter substrate binding protein [Reyranellaceae bacterium]
MKLSGLRFALVALSVGLLGQPAMAQDYPTRPITIVVPSAPGGLSDGFVRLVGDSMQRSWGQPVVMEHRPGAGGIVGTQHVAGTKPDGYTLLMGNIGPLAINPGLYKELPYDANKHFAPVALVSVYPNVLVVHPSLPINSVGDMIRYAKEKPGTLNYASAGVGQSQHLSGEMFRVMAGVDIVHVMYKGTGPALADLVGGHIETMFSNVPAAVPYIQSGKLRPLGVTGLTRSKALPDVPTISESGVPGYNVISWLALVAPAGTPPAIVDRLNAEVMKALASPEGQKHLEMVGANAGTGSPAEFRKFLLDEQKKWGELIKKADIKLP